MDSPIYDDKQLERMPHKQLRSELKKVIRQHTHKDGCVPSYAMALGTVLLAVLDNTKTKENPFGKLAAYPR